MNCLCGGEAKGVNTKMNKMPKIIAVYLPQFHETEDNNRWWGKGFTDWESVKTAEMYFDGHAQPRVPLEENYYRLTPRSSAYLVSRPYFSNVRYGFHIME